jgi:hypothetical protein
MVNKIEKRQNKIQEKQAALTYDEGKTKSLVQRSTEK